MLNFNTFQRLSSKQWWWLWCAYWRLWLANIRIKFRQDAWLRSKLSVVDMNQEARSLNKQKLISSVDGDLMFEAVRIAARLHFVATDCLPKSIVLADMLRNRSCNARVFIGVSKQAKGLASHAWVEVDGVMQGEPQSVHKDFAKLID